MFEFVPVIESPCVNICRVERGSCAGCGRTLAEIARWSTTTDEDRRAVMAELPGRMAGRTPNHNPSSRPTPG